MRIIIFNVEVPIILNVVIHLKNRYKIIKTHIYMQYLTIGICTTRAAVFSLALTTNR